MAGLYDRIIEGAEDNLSVHVLKAVLVLRAVGTINDAQAQTILNEGLDTALAGDELTDVVDILAVLNAKSPAVNKVIYLLTVDSASMITEIGSTLSTDSSWRTSCEI